MLYKQALYASLVVAALASCSKPKKRRARVSEVATPVAALPKAGQVPADFPKLEIPADNPQSPEKVALGHQLFFDARLSVDGSRSCYSCHQNEHGNGGGDATAVGAKGRQLPRHSPTIWNVAYFGALYWDGRAPSLEAQATGAWAGGNMGVGKDNLAAKAAEIAKIPGYRDAFAKAFGDEGVTAGTIVKAIAAYERTLLCNDTAYDKFARGEDAALTEAQKRGLGVFLGKGQCSTCHMAPTFSTATMSKDGVYYNIGIGTQQGPANSTDLGRYNLTRADVDRSAFKTPTLRNISKSAPYFHDGSVASLREAVKIMASGGLDNPHKTKILIDTKLSDAEIDDLVVFLGALDCGKGLESPTLP